MKKSGKIIFGIVGVLLALGCCFALTYALFPGIFGKEEAQEPEGLQGIPIESIARQETQESVARQEGSAQATQESVARQETKESTARQESSAQETRESAAQQETQESAARQETQESATKESTVAESSEGTKESSAKEPTKESQSESTEQSSATEPATQDQLNDRNAPVFLSFTASPQIKVGNSFDVHKYIGYADDVDRNVDMEVSGTVDVNKVGTYTIRITLTDDTGKKTSKNMDVKVVESTSSGSSGSSKKENFSDFVKNYKKDDNMLGIDVSRWQENIDFEKAKAAGCEFVYMRLGGYDNGEHYTDKYFKQNLAGAKAAGMKIGIYWHAEEKNQEEIKASVNYLLDVLGGEKLDFPIAYDWEDYKNFENYGMNLQDLNALLTYFEDELEARGYWACLYGSKNAQETIWTVQKKHPVWLAHYTSATSYTGKYFMWQHSNVGRIDGINGDVDLDVFYPSKLQMP